jgi:Flp pilus assembly protein TadG
MNFFKKLSELRHCKRGNTLVVVAATMPLLIAASAIGLDTIQLTVAKRHLQRAADSAALAGAYNLAQSKSASDGATRDLQVNSVTGLSTPAVIQNAPTTGPYAGNTTAVRVVLSQTRSVPFISFFTGSSMPVEVESTAALVFAGEHCVISLEDTAVTGINFSGSATANLGCGVATNSTASQAVVADGASRVTATPVMAVGGLQASSSYLGNTQFFPRAMKQTDPYAGLQDPVLPTPCLPQLDVQPQQTRTLSPGCYSGMDIKGTVTFSPGTYFINGGTLQFGATATVQGDGVTFVLTSSNATSNPASIATLSMHGNAVLNLKAPTSGTYKGILFYQDRRAPINSVTINGNAASVFRGAFYFPTQLVTFSGNAGVQTRCIQFVARRMTFTGNSSIQNECPEEEGSKAFKVTAVRIVA